GPHLYEYVAVMAAARAAGVVSVRQDRRRPRLRGGAARQSPGAVAGAARGCARSLRLDRDAEPRCVPDSILLFRSLARLGAAAAHARLSLLLHAGGDLRLAGAGLCAPPQRRAALAVVGLCRDRGRGLRCDAADLGSVHRHVDDDVQPPDDFPELDLEEPGDPAPVDAVMPGEMREVDRERLPVGIAVVVAT